MTAKIGNLIDQPKNKATTTSNNNASRSGGRKISFGTVEIREYPIVLSTNPGGGYGPSIELGWEYRYATEVATVSGTHPIEGQQISVKEYEVVRPKRRNLKELYIYQPAREERLRKMNYTDDEISEAVREKLEIFRSRQISKLSTNPVDICRKEFKSFRKEKKIKRAVRNLKKGRDHDKIYEGWWFPLSAHVF